MDVTILSENTKLKNSNLHTEHGLSLLVEKDDNIVLFDTGGPEGSAIQNAESLNLELCDVDAVVISHGHDDHTGGLLDFFKLNDDAPVYLKKEALNPHYTCSSNNKELIGMDERIIEDYSNRLKFISETTEILEDFFVIPNIYQKYPTPTTNNILFSKEDNKMPIIKFVNTRLTATYGRPAIALPPHRPIEPPPLVMFTMSARAAPNGVSTLCAAAAVRKSG